MEEPTPSTRRCGKAATPLQAPLQSPAQSCGESDERRNGIRWEDERRAPVQRKERKESICSGGQMTHVRSDSKRDGPNSDAAGGMKKKK